MYYMKDLYPNMGAVNTHGLSVPEPEEQMAIAHVEEENKAPKAVSSVSKKSVWTWLGVLLILCVLLHIGR